MAGSAVAGVGVDFWETLRERGLMPVLGMAWMTFEALADHAA